MLNRDRLEKVAQAMDDLQEIGIWTSCDLKSDSAWSFWAWCEAGMEEEKRRKVIAIMTRLVGKMMLSGDHWKGNGNGIDALAYQAQACKILGHKRVTKMVKKEVEREPEYEEVEQEFLEPITDCDIKAGRYSEEDIEVPA
jgi:hypothetical protein